MTTATTAPRKVHVRRGQTCEIALRKGIALEVIHLPSGAVMLRNANTGIVIRSWGPKDKDGAKGG